MVKEIEISLTWLYTVRMKMFAFPHVLRWVNLLTAEVRIAGPMQTVKEIDCDKIVVPVHSDALGSMVAQHVRFNLLVTGGAKWEVITSTCLPRLVLQDSEDRDNYQDEYDTRMNLRNLI